MRALSPRTPPPRGEVKHVSKLTCELGVLMLNVLNYHQLHEGANNLDPALKPELLYVPGIGPL